MKALPALIFLFTLISTNAWAQINLDGNSVNFQANGAAQSLALEGGVVTKVRNSNIVFAFIDNPEAMAAAGLNKPALFFFDSQGKFMGAYAGDSSFDPEMCADASLSPNGKIIALDNGTWLVRIWAFFTFPDFSPITGDADPESETNVNLSYFSSDDIQPLAWVDNNTVITTDLSQTPVARPCPSDPCEPLDVVIHYLKPWQSHALAAGTELCNYTLSSLSGRTVTVNKTCTKNIDDWAAESGAAQKTTKEKLQLPQ
ncbi:hypothetical protein LJB99_00415 [Deltaproteobacteria bacterium OttesenSCG-928-K17]|nr:hypothetical protein [Deltaproteobacteria bacterium OttesenSCG-928-K17]